MASYQPCTWGYQSLLISIGKLLELFTRGLDNQSIRNTMTMVCYRMKLFFPDEPSGYILKPDSRTPELSQRLLVTTAKPQYRTRVQGSVITLLEVVTPCACVLQLFPTVSTHCDHSRLLVLESPVRSGFLPKNGLTVTVTGLLFFSGVKKPDLTAMDRLRSVY